ncbi:MAG: hypothetical protein HYW47_07760 [Deltaproteobacteria bacterium]|nr:hypothetical protein [Deltaproteobacteria bacterium]
MKKLLSFIICSLFLGLFSWVYGESFSQVKPHEVSFQKILDLNNVQGELIVFGDSFLENGKLKKESALEIPQNIKIHKALFMWMGEGLEGEKSTYHIEFKTKEEKVFKILPQKTLKEKNTRFLHVHWADVTTIVKPSQKYQVRYFQFEKIPIPLDACGWALILITENKNSFQGRFQVFWGLQRLQPGELYNFTLQKSGATHDIIHSVAVIGGHGQKGNGSGNSLNGKTLSQGEDWDGSSGERWDADFSQVDFFGYKIDQGVIVTIDPLLQWIFPLGFALKTGERQ